MVPGFLRLTEVIQDFREQGVYCRLVLRLAEPLEEAERLLQICQGLVGVAAKVLDETAEPQHPGGECRMAGDVSLLVAPDDLERLQRCGVIVSVELASGDGLCDGDREWALGPGKSGFRCPEERERPIDVSALVSALALPVGAMPLD